MRKKGLVTQLAALFILNIMLISLFSRLPDANAVVYKIGSSGQTVRSIQTRLKNWGYYSGNVDGIFGTRTEAAVKMFQAYNGLVQDGYAGEKTLAALGIQAQQTGSSGSSSSHSSDQNLLARIISAEARGEPYAGQVAVGAVVLNRVRHPSFPNSVSGVIYQSGAFTAIIDGQFNEAVSDSARRAAYDALNGWDPSGGAIYYYNPSKSTNTWIYSREVIKTIGKHVFAK